MRVRCSLTEAHRIFLRLCSQITFDCVRHPAFGEFMEPLPVRCAALRTVALLSCRAAWWSADAEDGGGGGRPPPLWPFERGTLDAPPQTAGIGAALVRTHVKPLFNSRLTPQADAGALSQCRRLPSI
jgi:hypothetical protein